MIITIDSIVNHGTVIQILGTGADGRLASVVGDWRPMSHAIEGLGLAPGVEVGYDGETLYDANDEDADAT